MRKRQQNANARYVISEMLSKIYVFITNPIICFFLYCAVWFCLFLSESKQVINFADVHFLIMWQDEQVGLESMKMFKVRAALEENLKQKGLFSTVVPQTDNAQKLQKPLNRYFALLCFKLMFSFCWVLNQLIFKTNRKLETYGDFDDDTSNVQVSSRGLINGHASSLSSSKLSRLIAANPNKPKVQIVFVMGLKLIFVKL